LPHIKINNTRNHRMKMKLLVAAAATVVASSAMAQSAFQGFYGQIATGYESNSASSLNGTVIDPGTRTNFSASNQTFSGMPLVVGLGYNFTVAPKWLLGIGADYSALSITSSTYSSNIANSQPNAKINGQAIEVSNRFNIFLTPGYEIDKDKLVYLKAGYSSVQAKSTGPNSYSQTGFSESLASPSTTSTLNGYVLGLGYKQIISGGLYGFAEGNYMSYNKANTSSTVRSPDGTSSAANSNANLSSYQLLVGVGYRF
jgi:outer membrane immunogenic protein